MKKISGLLFIVLSFSFLNLVHSSDVGIALKPNYTSISWNVSYKSLRDPPEIYNGFIRGYYKCVDVIIDFILPDALPEELFSLGFGDIIFTHIGKIIWAYRRLCVFVIILIIQIFFLIGSNIRVLCSCLFFCTKCCHGTSSKSSSKFRKWLWLVWAYTALVFLLLMLVLAHQSNQNLDDGIDTVVLTLQDTIVDIETFIDTTVKQLEILLLTNLEDYLAFFLDSGEKTTMDVMRDLEGILGAIDFSEIFNDIEDNFNIVKPIFDEIETILGEVEDLGKTINKDIVGLKNMVENLICETAECEQLKKLIPSLESVYDGGAILVNGTYAELKNIAGLGEKGLEDIGNFTYMIGGKAVEEEKALENLTAKIAGNVIKDLEITGGGLANLTSAIGGEAIEEGKALENLTADIAGNVVKDLEITGGGLVNLTSPIGGEAIEEGKALENLTANIAENVMEDLEITGGGLANLTSAIGGEAIEDGKALENLTANIAGNVVKDLEITGGDLVNLTSAIGGEAIEEGKALENLTANIAGDVIKDLENTGGGLANLTSAIGGEAIEEGKALENLTANIAGNVIKDFEITGGGLANLTTNIGGEVIEEEKALENLTANIAGNVIEDFKITGGGLANLTSAIGGEAIEEGKALENLTANIAGNVIKDFEITGGGLANLTSDIGGEVIEKEKALENLTANIAGNVLKDLEITGGGLANLTSDIGGEVIEEGKALENLTANIAGNVVKDLEITGGGLTNLTSAIGGEVMEGGKALENLTSNVAGNVIGGLEDTGEGLTNLTENLVGGLEDVAGGVGNEIKNEGKALKDLTKNVAGGVVSGIGNVAGGLEDEVEDIFGGLGDWTFGTAGTKKKSKHTKHKNSTNSSMKNEKNNTVGIEREIKKEQKNLENSTAKVVENVNKSQEDTSSLTENIAGGHGKIAGGVENEIKNEGKAVTDLTKNVAGGVVGGIENVAGGIENEVGGLFKGLGDWTFGAGVDKKKSKKSRVDNVTSDSLQNNTKQKADVGEKVIAKGEALQNLTTDLAGNGGKDLKNSEKNWTTLENIVGGLENVAGGMENEMKNEGKALKDLTENVAGGVVGGIENVAGGIENEVGGLFKGLGDWTFGSGSKKENTKQSNANSDTAQKTNNKDSIGPENNSTNNTETKDEGKNEITNIFGSFGSLSSGKEKQIDESTMDLTMHLKNAEEDSSQIGQANGFSNLFAGLDDFASKMEKGVEKSIGNSTTEVKNKAGSIFGGLESWSSGKSSIKKNKDKIVISSTTARTEVATTLKSTEKKSQSGFGSFFGGLENLASGVTNGISKSESKLAGLTSKVVGGVEDAAGGVESKIGGLFGDWSSGGSDTNQNKALHTKEKISGSRNEETTTIRNGNNGFGGWFGGSAASNGAKKKGKNSKDSGGIGKTVSGVENKISDASKKLYDMGGSFFGFRKKRAFGLSLSDLKGDFNIIFNTIDRIENYVVNDLKHLNNVSVLLSPVIDEIDSIVKNVLVEVESELKEATKPLEGFFAATLDRIIHIENSILNATHIIQGTQEFIDWFEVYRYHISNFIAAALLLSFSLLAFGISVRMNCNNAITKCFYKGGFTLLHITALLMAAISLIYIMVGVTSQKVMCETLDTNYREDNIMRILSRINPATYGLLIDINLHKVILKCHQDQSLYEVAALESIMNVEEMALKFFDIDSIEKEFEPLLNMKLDLSKYLPLNAIHTIEEDLNFGAFEKILDCPIFAQMEKLEEEFTHIPLIGPVIKTIADKILSFKDKIAAIKSPVQSANIGFPNLLSNIKKLLLDVENGLLQIENKTVKTLQDVVLNLKNTLVTSLKDYVYNRLIHSIEHEIGKCKPISAAYNSTLNSVCRRITTPANGHWFSLFVGVFLSIILIVISREVNVKIKRFKREEERDLSDETSKKVDGIEMKSFKDGQVVNDGEKDGIQLDDAV